PASTPVPYTTLFRSGRGVGVGTFEHLGGGHRVELHVTAPGAAHDVRQGGPVAASAGDHAVGPGAPRHRHVRLEPARAAGRAGGGDRKSTRLNSSHVA